MKLPTIVLGLLATGLAGIAMAPTAAADPCPEDGPNLYSPLNGEPFFYFCNGWTGGTPNCTYQDVNIAPGAFLAGSDTLTISSKGEACGGNCIIYWEIYLCDTDIWDETQNT